MIGFPLVIALLAVLSLYRVTLGFPLAYLVLLGGRLRGRKRRMTHTTSTASSRFPAVCPMAEPSGITE